MNLFDEWNYCIPEGIGSSSPTVGQLNISTPTHQPKLGTIHVQLVCHKDYIRVHIHSVKSYSVIPNNEEYSCMFSVSSNFVMSLLGRVCMFINAVLNTKSNVNQR